MTKLSVAIVTFNEEKKIADCIRSASFADEVIVVDGSSSDKTVEIAKKMGAKVFVVPNQPLMKKNMNLAFEKCSHPWILSLDADERISPSLKSEIKQAVGSTSFTAFKIPRKNLIFGKWIEHTGWYPDFQYRLFQKGKASFPEKSVHEILRVDGTIGELKNPIQHFHIHTVSQFLAPNRIENYTTVEAEKLIAEGRKVTWVDAIRFPWEEFLRRFFAWEGYRDGLHGLVLSLLMAFYWEIVFVKMWEHQGFFKYGDELFPSEVELAGKKMAWEARHWVMTATKNPVKKVLYKMRNKLPL